MPWQLPSLWRPRYRSPLPLKQLSLLARLNPPKLPKLLSPSALTNLLELLKLPSLRLKQRPRLLCRHRKNPASRRMRPCLWQRSRAWLRMTRPASYRPGKLKLLLRPLPL